MWSQGIANVLRKRASNAVALVTLLALAGFSSTAAAVPSFARQTGQNCVACHAGGQYPELTPYGRYFKLTGYTIGERAMPLSGMAVASLVKTSSTNDPNGDRYADFPKDGNLIFQTASLFLAGKVSDNVGGFAQFTYGNYDTQSATDSHWKGRSMSDNFDLRYADHLIDSNRDLIFGATLNNNPTVQDVWNSVPAWGYNVVPGSSGPGITPLLAGGLAQNVAGAGGYLFWNKTLYAELSSYRTADGIWSFMSQGFDTNLGNQQILKGNNPYWRIALSHDWGAHNAMIGAFGMAADVYPDATQPSGSTTRYRDTGIDAQYQYLLDPHVVTVQGSYIHERIHWADSIANQPGAYDAANGTALQALTNTSDTLDMLRLKASYVYQAKYGGSLSYFDVRGSNNSQYQTAVAQNDPLSPSVSGSRSSNPGTSAWTAEAFWLPVQYARVGVQYTWFTRFNGASSNYDGWGRSAKDNNTLFLYVWGAY
ncbi:MAG TPA: hypothetical protein VI279_05890 [Rhodocyclaceae bacterium]